MKNSNLNDPKDESYFEKEKNLLYEYFQLKKQNSKNYENEINEAHDSIKIKSNKSNKNKLINDSTIKDKSSCIIDSNKNLEDSSTILSICNDIVKKNDITSYEDLNYQSNSIINDKFANGTKNEKEKEMEEIQQKNPDEKIIKAGNLIVNRSLMHESSLSSSNNFVEINISPNSQVNNELNVNNNKSNNYKSLEKSQKAKQTIDSSYQAIPNLNLTNKSHNKKEASQASFPTQSLKSKRSKSSKNTSNQEYNEEDEDIKIYENCEEVIDSNTIKSGASIIIKRKNSEDENENELINNLLSNTNEENFRNFGKTANNENFSEEALEKQIALEREEYLMHKLDEIKDKIIVSDEKIMCAVCFNEVDLGELLNKEECKICQKGSLKSAKARNKSKGNCKENFFSNEEKDQKEENAKSIEEQEQEEYECSFGTESSFESSDAEEAEEKIKKSKYKFIIDKENLDGNRKRNGSRNMQEIEEFINRKKWNSGKNYNLINILNIRKPKQANIKSKKDEVYFVNYIQKKFSQNSIGEEENKNDNNNNNNNNKDSADKNNEGEKNYIYENSFKENEEEQMNVVLTKKKSKDNYDESEILDCSSPNKKSKNGNSEFTFNKLNNQRKKSNCAPNSNKQIENELLKKTLKESSMKTYNNSLTNNNSNYNSKCNSNNNNFLESLNITGDLHRSDRNNKRISFDIYPQSTKEIATRNFAKYKKENDNKLLKKILKVSKMKEILKKKKLNANNNNENSDSIANLKADTIKKILKNAKKDKEKRKKEKLKKLKKTESKIVNETTDSNVEPSKTSENNKKEKRKNSSMNVKNKKKMGEEFKKKLYATAKETEEVNNMNKFGLCTWCCKDSSNRRENNNCIIF